MNKNYAVIDIETTGGHLADGCITEVAIYIFDGQKIIQSYESLIKPFYYIPRNITVLTGITNEMVAKQPTFEELAAEIYALIKDCIFVAHNVNFDYSFIKKHLANSGFTLECPKLCTVKMARATFPGYKSYSLGRICADLNIPLENRHRAAGDAQATVLLLKKILEQQSLSNETTPDQGLVNKNKLKQHYLPAHLDAQNIDELPQCTGIYRFHDDKDKIIYIGKAVQIKKRVISHFTGQKLTLQRQAFLREVHRISYEPCSSTLLALIQEAIAIKKHWPKHNKALKNPSLSYGIFQYRDQQNFERLAIAKVSKQHSALRHFYDLISARQFLFDLCRNFDLCYEKCKVGDCQSPETHEEEHEVPDLYNAKVFKAVLHVKEQSTRMLIRTLDQFLYHQVLVMIDLGKYYGIVHLEKNDDIPSWEDLQEKAEVFEGTGYLEQLILQYALTHANEVTSM